jgi:hypothetical protein
MPDTHLFSTIGSFIITALLGTSVVLGGLGAVNLFRKQPLGSRFSTALLISVCAFFVAGLLLIGWFHYQIHISFSLELPEMLYQWINNQLSSGSSGYNLPLYDPLDPPRYIIPLWIENEKYFFWFLCYAFLALYAHCKLKAHKFRSVLHLFLLLQVAILYFVADPFAEPLPKFFGEIAPWFSDQLPAMSRVGLFMRLYPKMIFYYNAHYMWMHPPLLFLSYGCITITFISSLFMLGNRSLDIEKLGYDAAKLGFFMLTLGMLLGYPWALKAWGPNWWWDPKICSSLMMWAVYSTYLHTRLYVNKPFMWYFSSVLGIVCFIAMIFTFLASFFFPGEHTFQ